MRFFSDDPKVDMRCWYLVLNNMWHLKQNPFSPGENLTLMIDEVIAAIRQEFGDEAANSLTLSVH